MAVKTKKKSMQYGDAAEAAEKASTGSGGKSISLPEGFGFYPMKAEKQYKLRFAPYLVGDGNPDMPAGNLFYTRKYWSHSKVGGGDGGMGDTYVCARRTFGRRCAVCDFVVRLRQVPSTNEKLLKELEPKQRSLFIVRDQEEKEKGWRILDYSYHGIGKMLEAKLKASRHQSADDDEVVQYEPKKFYHLEGGAVVKILMEDAKLPFKWNKASSIDMVPTKEVLPDDFVDGMPCLDDVLIEPDYDVLEQVLTQGDADPVEEDDVDAAPPPVKGKAKKVEPEDDEDLDEDEDEYPVAKPGKSKAKPAPEPEDDDESEVEEDDDDDEQTETHDVPQVGSTVKFTYNGKTFKGVVKKVNEDAENCSIQTEGRDKPNVVDFGDITEVLKPAPKAAKPGTPAAKVAAKKKPVAPVEADEDDDFDDFDEETEDEETEDEETEDEETEDEEEPAPKKKKGKPEVAAKKKAKKFEVAEDEDDDFALDDDDDEEPAPKKKAKK